MTTNYIDSLFFKSFEFIFNSLEIASPVGKLSLLVSSINYCFPNEIIKKINSITKYGGGISLILFGCATFYSNAGLTPSVFLMQPGHSRISQLFTILRGITASGLFVYSGILMMDNNVEFTQFAKYLSYSFLMQFSCFFVIP